MNRSLAYIIILSAVIVSFVTPANAATWNASFTPEINYQGRLVTPADAAVPDGLYNIRFKLYTASSGGSPIWTETLSGANQVQVTSGLFSVMLGAVTSLTTIDFNQVLYLTIEVGGTGGSPSWDGEMTPRKVLGAVPAAMTAYTLNGLDSTQFVRSDANSTITGDLIINGNSTTTAATTTRFFSTTGTVTNLSASTFTGAGLTTCNNASSALMWNAGTFSCHTISGGGGGTDVNWSFFNGSGIMLATTTNQVLIGGSATTSTAKLEVVGGIQVSASTTLQDFTFTNATGSQATTTSLFFTKAQGGSLIASGLGTFQNLLVLGSTTLQDFTAHTSTSSQATTTNFFTTTGTHTNLYFTTANGATETLTGTLTAGNLLVNGSSTLQSFTFVSATGTQATTSRFAISSITSKLLKADANGSVIGAIAGSDYENPLTFSAGVARSTNSITVDQNFSPTWTGAHIFDNITRSTTTQATTTSFAISNISSKLLKTLANGSVVGAIAGADYQAAGNYALQATVISAGAGLTGGGDLSTNRSLAIDYTAGGTWTGAHIFDNITRSTTTQATSTNFFSTTGTVTNLTASTFTGAGLTACNNVTSALMWNAGTFSCHTISGGGAGGTDLNWVFFNGSGIYVATTTNQVLIGGTATTSTAKLEVVGGIQVSASTTLQEFTFTNATGSQATTTSLFFTKAQGGSLIASGLGTFQNLLTLGSTTLQDFTAHNSTSTQATTTNFFTTTGTHTNLYYTTANGTTETLTGTLTAGNLLVNGSSTLQSFTFVTATGTQATTTSLFSSVLTSSSASTTNLIVGSIATSSNLILTGALNSKPILNLSGTNLATPDGSGTAIGANFAALGGDFIKFQVAGSDRVRLTNAGSLTLTSSAGGNFISLTPNAGISTVFGYQAGASSTLQDFTFTNATGTQATTTNLFASTLYSSYASTTNLTVGGVATSSSLVLTGPLPLVSTKSLLNLSGTNLVAADSSGTYLGANPAALGGDFIRFQVNGSDRVRLTNGGILTLSNAVNTLSLSPSLGIITAFGIQTGASSTLQDFTFTNATGTTATTSRLAISSITSKLLKTNSNGSVIGAIAGSDYENPLTFSAGVARSTNSITVDQNFSPTWTGAHIFDNITRSTTTQATTTSLFSTTATFSNLIYTTGNGGNLTLSGLMSAVNVFASGSSTLQNFTFVNATGTQATTTSLFSTNATFGNLNYTTGNGTNLTLSGLLSAANVFASGSSTLQSFTFVSATGTQATTSRFAISSITSKLLKADANGSVIGAIAGSDYENPLTFSAGVARSTNSITVDQNFSPTWTGAHIFDNITRSTTTQATTTSLAVLGLTASNCDVKSTTGGTLFCGTDAGAGAAPLPNSKWATSTIPNSNGIYVNGGAGTDVLIGGVATTSTQKLEVIGGAYFSGNVGIGTTTPYAKLSVVGEIVGAYFTGTTTATSTFGGPIQASSLVSLLSSTSGLTFGGTSTPSILTLDTINSRVQVGLGAGSASPSLLVLDTKNTSGDPAGINGAMYYNSNMGIFRCFANSQWGTCGSQATTTKVMLSDCSPKITSTDFAPGGSWWQPLDMANDLIGMGGWAFQEATSSEVTCIAHIPKNISASPNAQLWSAWTSTSTSALSNVLDIDIASINPATGSVDPAAFTNIMASTSAAKRLTVAAAAWGSVSTSTSIGLTLPNTNDLVVRFRRYGANANDSSNSDLYLWSQWLEVKVDSQ